MKAATAFLLLSYLSISHGWYCRSGPHQDGAAQIDAGEGQVVMRDGNSLVYSLSGSTWNRLGSVALKHVSVGQTGIWGVDSSDVVYRYIAGDFIRSDGDTLHQVDAGGDGQIVGVTSSSTIHCLDKGETHAFRGEGSVSWSALNESLVYISCSPHGCWGVNSEQNTYFGVISPATCIFKGWVPVEGAAVMVEVGTDGTVFKVDAAGDLYQRAGISSNFPQGTHWDHIKMSATITHATYDLGHLWLITNTSSILECSRTGWFCESAPQHSGAEQIDAGNGDVVLTDNNSLPYLLTGSEWHGLGSVTLKHISVGLAGKWGVDNSDNIYKYIGSEFIHASGQQLTQVDAGGNGQVVGVTNSSSIHCLNSTSASNFQETGSLSWDTIDGKLIYFSCSPKGCWGVNPEHDIYFTTVTPETCAISGWTKVPGKTVMVKVGADGKVFVMNAGGNLFQRVGISAAFPHGTDWIQIPMSQGIKSAAYDLGHLWLISSTGHIMNCFQKCVDCL